MIDNAKPMLLLAAAFGMSGAPGGQPDPSPGACAIGHLCPDGTLMAGRSLTSGKRLFTTATDAKVFLPWDTGNRFVPSDAQSDSDGKVNLVRTALTGKFQSLAAINYCASLKDAGHDDWYLPARDELWVLYGNRTALGNFDTKEGVPYWSSSEAARPFAWSQSFSSGLQNGASKSLKYHVRCVREASL